MSTEPHKHLSDVIDAIDIIRGYVSGLTFDQYLADLQVRDAVERRFGIIGEALERLRRDAPDLHAQVDRAREIKRFRNIIVHGYDVIDQEIAWRVIETDFPPLREQAQQLLDELQL